MCQILQKKNYGKSLSLLNAQYKSNGKRVVRSIWTSSNPSQRKVRLREPSSLGSYSLDWCQGGITGTSRFYAGFLPNGVQTEKKTRNRDFISIYCPFAFVWNSGAQRTRRASELVGFGEDFSVLGKILRREAAL